MLWLNIICIFSISIHFPQLCNCNQKYCIFLKTTRTVSLWSYLLKILPSCLEFQQIAFKYHGHFFHLKRINLFLCHYFSLPRINMITDVLIMMCYKLNVTLSILVKFRLQPFNFQTPSLLELDDKHRSPCRVDICSPMTRIVTPQDITARTTVPCRQRVHPRRLGRGVENTPATCVWSW